MLLASPANTQVQPGVVKPSARVLQTFTMPKLVGLTPDSANRLLVRYHRQIDSVHRIPAKPPLGIIVSQSPDSGSAIMAGVPITVRVAALPRIVAAQVPKLPANPALAESLQVKVPQTPTMPNLVGLTPDSADKLLARRYHLRIGRVSYVVAKSPPGTIVWQSPDSGSAINAGLSVAVRVATPPDDVAARVPTLVGRTSREVAESLKGARLAAGPIAFVVDPTHAGRVVRQSPPPESVVPPGTQVSVTYGRADTLIPVPRVLDMPPENASAILGQAGLSLGGMDSVPGLRRTVIRQDPLENTRVPRGSAVRILYSYHRLVVVPDLSRSTVDAASRALAEVGLSLGQIGSTPTDGDTGRVIAQQPAPQTRVDSGTSVSITVGRARQVIVPFVVGRTFQDAEAMLTKVGLRVGSITRAEVEGRADVILAQKPDSGTQVKPGFPVALQVSVTKALPPADVVVPRLLGLRLDAVRSLLEARRLTLGGVRYDVRKRGDSTVYWQSIPEETKRPPGTAVGVRIGVPRPVVAVPDVVGLDSAAAQRVLADSGFSVGVAGTKESDRPPGTVLSQSPNAGAPSARGVQVSVLLARPRAPLVPDVLGMKAADAEAKLATVHLRVRSDTQLAFGADGIVTDQRPGGGAVITPGLIVELTVGWWPTVWLWVIGIAGSLGTMAAVGGPMSRRIRDWRWRRRLTYVPMSASGTHTLQTPAEPLLKPDFQLQPISSPPTHALKVDGPLFPEDSS